MALLWPITIELARSKDKKGAEEGLAALESLEPAEPREEYIVNQKKNSLDWWANKAAVYKLLGESVLSKSAMEEALKKMPTGEVDRSGKPTQVDPEIALIWYYYAPIQECSGHWPKIKKLSEKDRDGRLATTASFCASYGNYEEAFDYAEKIKNVDIRYRAFESIFDGTSDTDRYLAWAEKALSKLKADPNRSAFLTQRLLAVIRENDGREKELVFARKKDHEKKSIELRTAILQEDLNQEEPKEVMALVQEIEHSLKSGEKNSQAEKALSLAYLGQARSEKDRFKREELFEKAQYYANKTSDLETKTKSLIELAISQAAQGEVSKGLKTLLDSGADRASCAYGIAMIDIEMERQKYQLKDSDKKILQDIAADQQL